MCNVHWPPGHGHPSHTLNNFTQACSSNRRLCCAPDDTFFAKNEVCARTAKKIKENIIDVLTIDAFLCGTALLYKSIQFQYDQFNSTLKILNRTSMKSRDDKADPATILQSIVTPNTTFTFKSLSSSNQGRLFSRKTFTIMTQVSSIFWKTECLPNDRNPPAIIPNLQKESKRISWHRR